LDAVYMLACGIVWAKTADPEAGWDLLDGLTSGDPGVRLLAQTLLVKSGESSMGLLESAVAEGILDPKIAGPCMAEILRIQHGGHVTGQPVHELCSYALGRELAHSN